MSTYVLQGILYFLMHPSLWLTSICPLIMTILIGLVSVILLFSIGLSPQVAAFESIGVPSGWAWLLGVLCVIVEIFLVTLIYSLACLPCYMDKIVDQVLTLRGHGELVENDKNHSGCTRICTACCRVSVLLRLFVLIITIPLNLIPFVGTIVWVWLNGKILAWEYHLYYFELKGYSYREQKQIIDARQMQYTSFGMQAMLLEMIPLFGFLFLFTNSVGAALFAADIEEELLDQNVLPLEPYGTH
jgi:uncharacterized protein involved in cysteine biosynthesis